MERNATLFRLQGLYINYDIALITKNSFLIFAYVYKMTVNLLFVVGGVQTIDLCRVVPAAEESSQTLLLFQSASL